MTLHVTHHRRCPLLLPGPLLLLLLVVHLEA
jgi:hypothetical protein